MQYTDKQIYIVFINLFPLQNAAQNCRKRANDRLSDLTAITYIENEDLKNNYEKLKKDKQEKGELYEEILLFHGTDEENIDEIFINNFDINRHPLKRKKVDRQIIRLYKAKLVNPNPMFRKWHTDEAFTCATDLVHAINMEKFSSSPESSVAALPGIL